MANRRSKAEIEAEKRVRAERKAELARKKAEREAKAKVRAEKKAERERKAAEKVAAAKAKELQKVEDAKIQEFIDSLKIGPKYCKALPMTGKERELCKKILSDSTTRLSLCHQTSGSHTFSILSYKDNEYVISIDSVYYFYNKEKNLGINFGSVFDTWLETCKRIPWNGTVNIFKEDKSGNNSTQNKSNKRTKKTA